MHTTKRGFFGASWHEFSHQNAARRTGTRMKIRHFCDFSILFYRSANQSRCLSLCSIVKRSQSNGRRVNRLRCCKLQRTMRTETESAVIMPISSLMVRDVVNLLCKADLTMCLSSRASVMGGCWDPACHSVRPLSTYWYHIYMTVDGCRPVRRAIE